MHGRCGFNLLCVYQPVVVRVVHANSNAGVCTRGSKSLDQVSPSWSDGYLAWGKSGWAFWSAVKDWVSWNVLDTSGGLSGRLL